MKKILLRSGIVLLVLIVISVVPYLLYASQTKTTIANIGTPQTMTVYWNFQAIPVSKSSPFYEKIVLATEQALDATRIIPESLDRKKVDESALYKGIVLEYNKPRTITVVGAPDSGNVKVEKIVIPLHEKDFDSKFLIAIDGDPTLPPLMTDRFIVEKLQSIADLYSAHVNSH